MTKLEELLARVEAATGPDNNLDWALFSHFVGPADAGWRRIGSQDYCDKCAPIIAKQRGEG